MPSLSLRPAGAAQLVVALFLGACASAAAEAPTPALTPRTEAYGWKPSTGCAPEAIEHGSLCAACDVVNARGACEARCGAGDGDAYTLLGNLFESGAGASGPDPARAAAFFEEGCARHSVWACMAIAYRWRDVSKNPSRALELFRRHCEEGFGPACREEARAYFGGRGVNADVERALALVRSACGLGDPVSCRALVKPALKEDPHRTLYEAFQEERRCRSQAQAARDCP